MPRRDDLAAPSATTLKASMRATSRRRREALADIQGADASARRNGDPVLDLTIEMLPIDELKAADRRVKRSDQAQRARVRASLLRFGVVTPVLIDRSGVIIHGHVVVEAARDLELRQLPCVRLEHLSADEVRLLSITLNRLAETGDWDVEALRLEFQELVILDEPLTVTGFDEPIIDGILLGDTDDLDPVQEDIPALGADAISRPGDIWRLREHRLACGDARNEALRRRLLDDELARLGLIDPPYNVPIQHNVTTRDHREFAMASGEMTEAAFIDFLTQAYRTLAGGIITGGLLLSFMDWRGHFAMTSAARALSLEEIGLIVWAKTNAGMGSLWRSQHELIGAYKKPGAPHLNNVALGKSGRWRSNVWRYPGASSLGSDARRECEGHPTPKPVALLVDAILDVTNRGDIVVDTFSGSGSTLIACERSGRRFRGAELDPLYVDLAVRRWERETGGKAELEGRSVDAADSSPPPTDAARPRVRVRAGSSTGRA